VASSHLAAVSSSWLAAYLLAFLGAALASLSFLAVRLARLSRWKLRVTPILWQERRPLMHLMFAEGCYSVVAAVLLVAAGATRPIDTTLPANQQAPLTWILFGVAMNIVGSPLLSGGAERVLQSLEAETDRRPISRAAASVMEIILIRKTARSEIENSFYEMNREVLEESRDVWKEPLVWAVEAGWLSFEAVDKSFVAYLEFRGLREPDYLVELRQASKDGDNKLELAKALIHYIWTSSHSAALMKESFDYRYLMESDEVAED
jgi:hypothetical protein